MHKSRQFINKSIKTYEKDIRIKNHLDKNIIFLDIDGVIQPPLMKEDLIMIWRRYNII